VKNEGEIVICYPVKDESLWDIAKRYAVPQSFIKQDKNEKFVVING
jgi:hypothetical protein